MASRSKAHLKLDAKSIKTKFDYCHLTGRLTRVARGRGARVGAVVGHVGKNGFRRISLNDANYMASAIVWAWHHGVIPDQDILRKNGDPSDDRIENLILRSDVRVPVKVLSGIDGEYSADDMRGDLQGYLNTGIYEIRNTKNGRRYIGSAVDISKRWRQHLKQLQEGNHHSRFLQRCWNKSGADSFVFRVVLCCVVDNLIIYEQSAIDALLPEYNSAPKAGSQLGYKHTKETRKKMSESRPKDFSPMTGKRHSEETKKKISESRKGKGGTGWTQERKDKISNALKGRVITDEQREKISETLKGHKQSSEQIKRRMKSMPEGHYQRVAMAKSKLSESQVKEIKKLLSEGFSLSSIADNYGISRSAASRINLGKSYAWVIV